MKAAGDGRADQLERRLALLTARVAAEAAERQRLQQQLETVTAELAALRGAAPGTGRAASVEANVMQASPRSVGQAAPSQAAQPGTAAGGSGTGASASDGSVTDAGVTDAGATDGVSVVERALVVAGVDPGAAAGIKRRQDGLALEEVYLRDQATREQWMDTPRFADEMAKIESQRGSLRNELGDDAYDRYLAALGHPNRVKIDDVLLESPAAQAGLQAGDIVMRYGDTRIFATEDLIAETHRGTPGESVRIDLMRKGQPIEVDVPRGPLGVNIAPLPPPLSSR